MYKRQVIAAADLAAWVQKLAPAKVVVLGDAQYVSPECVAALGVAAPVILADNDWAKNGTALADLLGEPKLQDAYSQCLAVIDEMLQRSPAQSKVPVPVEPQPVPVTEPAAVATPAVPAEPTVAPVTAAPVTAVPEAKKAEPAVTPPPVEPVVQS